MGELNEHVVRIGSGAGYSGDRIDPAVDLVSRGELDYLVFECLGERTVASAQLAKLEDATAGFDPLLQARMRAVLPAAAARGTRIVTNMGAANPVAAAERTVQVAHDLGLSGLRVACVLGDDVLPLVVDDPHVHSRNGGVRPVSANAYLGADAVLAALREGADVVITGRVADAALFLGPLRHEFGWPDDAWQRLAGGTLVGHLLECAGQLTGGYFADPVTDPVSDLADLGFPLAEVVADGTAVLGKLPDTGGRLDRLTTTAQLLYEVTDPRAYLTPDVTLDLSGVHVEEIGQDAVRVVGARGGPPPKSLKALVGSPGGYLGEGQISYRGPGARERAELAGRVVRTRLRDVHGIAPHQVRTELIGCGDVPDADPPEVRLRVAATADRRCDAENVGWEVETLYTNGPAGGGGAQSRTRALLDLVPIAVPRDAAEVSVRVWRVGDSTGGSSRETGKGVR